MIEIQGADQFARLAKQLKEAGDKDLQKELGQAINRAVRPVKADIRRSARDQLPKRGGLAKQVATGRLTTRTRSRGLRGAAGVRVVASNKLSLHHLNQGEVRHRKGGNINAGKVQHIPPGWWTKPTEGNAPKIREELVAAMDRIAKKIDRSV